MGKRNNGNPPGRPSVKGLPRLQDATSFSDLKEIIRIRSVEIPTDYMDLLLLENKDKTLSEIIQEYGPVAKKMNNNDFHTVSRVKAHLKYREERGWIFRRSGNPEDPVVKLVGFK